LTLALWMLAVLIAQFLFACWWFGRLRVLSHAGKPLQAPTTATVVA
jgi:hypothetical protein